MGLSFNFLNYIQDGIKDVLDSIKFDLLKPEDIVSSLFTFFPLLLLEVSDRDSDRYRIGISADHRSQNQKTRTRTRT